MWGIIPAAGRGSRIQPLAFSKELLPIGGRNDESPAKPRAVSDFLIERMVCGGADRLCFVIAPGKSDILEYYGGSAHSAALCYTVQPEPTGLCDSIFRAVPFVDVQSPVLIGLPDTIWFPADGFGFLPQDRFSFLLFPVPNPEQFDAVLTDAEGLITRIEVKQSAPSTHWIWGAVKIPGAIFVELFELWKQRGRRDEYLGTLVNAWIERGGRAYGARIGESYFDVGTIDAYCKTIQVVNELVAAGIA